MRIEYLKKDPYYFNYLKDGDVFHCDTVGADAILIRIRPILEASGNTVNAVNLITGEAYTFTYLTRVRLCPGKFVCE